MKADPESEHQAARAVALFRAPRSLGSGTARPPRPQVRSHDAATVCQASRAARGPPRGGPESGTKWHVSGPFSSVRTPVLRRGCEGPRHPSLVVRARPSYRPRFARCAEGGWTAGPASFLYSAPSGRRSPASPPGSRPRSRRAEDLRCGRLLRRRTVGGGVRGIRGRGSLSTVGACAPVAVTHRASEHSGPTGWSFAPQRVTQV
jgi:hypothetical protein